MELSFAQAIAANQAMDPGEDPDFIITVNGEQIKEHFIGWRFIEDSKDQSELEVTLANPDMSYTGKFKYEQKMQIRFGYRGALSPKAYFRVARIRKKYPLGKPWTITVTGRDVASLLAGGSNRGKHGEGPAHKDLENNLKARGLSTDCQGEGPEGPLRAHNENDRELAYRVGNTMKGGLLVHAGAAEPTSPFADEKESKVEGTKARRDEGHTYSTAAGMTKDGRERSGNRARNHGGKHSQAPIGGILRLKGLPTLRANACVDVQGVDEDSGIYYVERVIHEWKQKDGYTSEAVLGRGGTGKGGVGGGEDPMEMHADIWREDTIILGPRKTNNAAQATFVYGLDPHLIDFEYDENPQKNRGGGEPKKNKGVGIDLDNNLATLDAAAAEGVNGQDAQQ